MTKLFTTDPHGAQELFELEPESHLPVHNRLFVLKDDAGHALTLTGEELTSLSAHWRDFTSELLWASPDCKHHSKPAMRRPPS
jgi:hypothetical protein